VSTQQDLATSAVEQATTRLHGAEVQVCADRHRLALTRFANSVIHQNVAEDATTVRVQIHHDGRTASASATTTDEAGLRDLVELVVEAARVAPHDPGWPGLALPAAAGTTPASDPSFVGATPLDRAEVVRAFVDGAGGLEAAGYCRTNHWSGGFANSAGHTLVGDAVESGFSGIARNRGADGLARHAPLRLADLDGGALGARAAAKALASADPIELPAGRYEVVLEPTAVADILESLAGVGFNGKTVNEHRSFVRVGEAQFDPSITIADEPLAIGLGYDVDGTPRQRLVVVDRGTTVSLTHDRRSAAEAGATSTGHGVTMPFAWGPAARHLSLLPSGTGTDQAGGLAGAVAGPAADSSVAELVAGVERGVLVSDFWYTRILDPRTLVITGLTRNGVWLIEGGTVTKPLRNFRFTQSYAQALMPGNVKAVGRTSTPMPGDTYTATSPRWSCPALHLASWNFTGGASG
jgi:predicted Zn-dependent protease